VRQFFFDDNACLSTTHHLGTKKSAVDSRNTAGELIPDGTSVIRVDTVQAIMDEDYFMRCIEGLWFFLNQSASQNANVRLTVMSVPPKVERLIFGKSLFHLLCLHFGIDYIKTWNLIEKIERWLARNR